jgi:hypothetical protein
MYRSGALPTNPCVLQVRLSVHVTGALVHGRHDLFFPFLSNLKHDSNTNITILLRVLNYLRTSEGQRGQAMPKSLYLQLDGGSENKNRFMLGFVAMLVYYRCSRCHWCGSSVTLTCI